MSAIREVLFSLLLNLCVQITLFAVMAAAFSRLVAKAKAEYQYSFYLCVMALCLTLPVINTLCHARPFKLAETFSQHMLREPSSPDHDLWIWNGHSKTQHQLAPGSNTQDVILIIWAALVLYQIIHFGRGLHRIHRLRKGARLLSPAEIGTAGSTIRSGRVALLASADLANPVTVGFLRPAIIVPSKLIPDLGKHELTAIFAHEYAHIRRRDFPVHILCQAITLPVAFHPGIRYLMSKISQTRELACDEQAAVQLGERRFYARTLLRLASLCSQATPKTAVGLGIFDGDNLEDRIMTLSKKRTSLSGASLIGLVLAIGVTFGSGAVLARATSRQTTGSADTAKPFAGTWHWMFQGRSFATMILTRSESGFTGSVTESRITLNDEGGLARADPSDDTMPKQITKAELDGSVLRVKVADGFEFTVTLKDSTHAEILPGGAPPNMKPISLDKVH